MHQFTRIGKHAFIAGGVDGGDGRAALLHRPGRPRRAGGAEHRGPDPRTASPRSRSRRIKDAYKILFRSKLGLNEAIAKLRAEHGGHVEIDELLEFVAGSTRGITR